MSKVFMPELEPEQRKRLLQDNNDGFEETTYYKDLSLDEVSGKEHDLSSNLMEMDKWDKILEAEKIKHKAATKPLKEQNRKLLQEITMRKEEVEGVLYHIADQEQGIMETYDENGEFVSSRRLRPDERQLKAFPLRKASGE